MDSTETTRVLKCAILMQQDTFQTVYCTLLWHYFIILHCLFPLASGVNL